MAMKLYVDKTFPTSRSVLMALDIFGVDAEIINVDLIAGECSTEEFKKLCPTKSTPVLVDGDVVLIESPIIVTYLAEKFGKNDAIYPKDLKKRAYVNQKLVFDVAVVYNRLANIAISTILRGEKKITKHQLKDVEETYSFMEEFLSRNKFLADDNITLADVSTIASISSLVVLVPPKGSYPKFTAWKKTMESQSYAQKHNADGAKKLVDKISSFLN